MWLRAVIGCAAALVASAQVSDYQWRLVRLRVERGMASEDPAKRTAALEQLGLADRPEATLWLVELLGSIERDRLAAQRERDAIRTRTESAQLEREHMARILHRRNWTDEEDATYRVLEARVDRLVRELATAEKALFHLERLAFAAIRQLSRHASSAAQEARRTALEGAEGPAAVGLIEALADAGDRAALPAIRTRVSAADPAVARAAILACAALDDRDAAPLIALRLADSRWRVRAAAIAASAELRSVAAVGALVERAERAVGREAGDVLAALTRITGFDHEAPADWRAWYEAHREELAARIAARREALAETGRSIGAVRFYGIHTASRRVAFCIDTSASMAARAGPLDPQITAGEPDYPTGGSKLVIAKYELRRALAALPEQARFNLVYFTANTKIAFDDGLIEAAPDTIQKLSQWLRHEVEAAGGTDLYGALRRALGLAEGPNGERAEADPPGIDTLFLLSDGAPSTGLLRDYAEILDDITRRNRRLGVAIHVVGVGREVDAEFLAALAARNGGRFLHTQH